MSSNLKIKLRMNTSSPPAVSIADSTKPYNADLPIKEDALGGSDLMSDGELMHHDDCTQDESDAVLEESDVNADTQDESELEDFSHAEEPELFDLVDDDDENTSLDLLSEQPSELPEPLAIPATDLQQSVVEVIPVSRRNSPRQRMPRSSSSATDVQDSGVKVIKKIGKKLRKSNLKNAVNAAVPAEELHGRAFIEHMKLLKLKRWNIVEYPLDTLTTTVKSTAVKRWHKSNASAIAPYAEQSKALSEEASERRRKQEQLLSVLDTPMKRGPKPRSLDGGFVGEDQANVMEESDTEAVQVGSIKKRRKSTSIAERSLILQKAFPSIKEYQSNEDDKATLLHLLKYESNVIYETPTRPQGSSSVSNVYDCTLCGKKFSWNDRIRFKRHIHNHTRLLKVKEDKLIDAIRGHKLDVRSPEEEKPRNVLKFSRPLVNNNSSVPTSPGKSSRSSSTTGSSSSSATVSPSTDVPKIKKIKLTI